MLIKYTTHHRLSGFSLIETLIAISILAFVTLTLYALFSLILQVTWENKARVGAAALANKKLEIAHNLPYNQVGTLTGVPTGTIPVLENISLNGISYTVQTQVIYIDDPYDGLEGEPGEALAADYKRVRVAVSWPTRLTHVPVVFLSDIVPNGIESEAGGGTLFIQVFDAYGQPVSYADINIINTSTGVYLVDVYQTNNVGEYKLPGTPPAIESYQIIVTKDDYSTDQTYGVTPDNPSPSPAHQTVFESRITSISFFIDLLSAVNIHVQDINGLALSDIPVLTQGQKTIGTTGPVYKYSATTPTDSGGNINLTRMEWDSYNFIVPSSTSWNIADSNPFQPLNILPNTTTNVVLTLEPQDPHCLRVVAKDINDQPVSEVSVRLYNATYDKYLKTSASGQVFFTPLNQATYTLTATSTEYVDYSDEFLITGYMVEQVVMTEP